MVQVYEFGPHRCEIEPPDIAHVHYSGDVSIAHVKQIDTLLLNALQADAVYLLRDARSGGIQSGDTRTFMARKPTISRLIAVVTYGASFHARTITTMTRTASLALTHTGPELVFVETEAEARAWIEDDRRRRQTTPNQTA